MYCRRCGRKTKYLFMNGEPICDECAKNNGFTICTEIGAYKDFQCSNVCGDCEYKDQLKGGEHKI